MKKIYFYSFILFSFLFFVCCITTYVVYSGDSFITDSMKYDFSTADYFWPLPKYHTISSPFGFRISPTSGASSYHSGIDIPAPEKTPIYSVADGIVTYLDFEGANGYTLKMENSCMLFSYSHIAPDFLVNIGDFVTKNQLIAQVGPKYISTIPSNPYTDSTRQSNKWRYHWLPLAFKHKNRWQSHRSSYFISLITYRLQNCPNLIQWYSYNLDIWFPFSCCQIL